MERIVCIGLTKKGKKCNNNVSQGYETCLRHRSQCTLEEKEDSDLSELQRVRKYSSHHRDINSRCMGRREDGQLCLRQIGNITHKCQRHKKDRFSKYREKIISHCGIHLPERTWIKYLMIGKRLHQEFKLPKCVFINCILENSIQEYEKVAVFGLLCKDKNVVIQARILWRDPTGRHLIAKIGTPAYPCYDISYYVYRDLFDDYKRIGLETSLQDRYFYGGGYTCVPT